MSKNIICILPSPEGFRGQVNVDKAPICLFQEWDGSINRVAPFEKEDGVVHVLYVDYFCPERGFQAQTMSVDEFQERCIGKSKERFLIH